MDKLLRTLEGMVESPNDDETIVEKYTDELYEIYKQEDFRHSYAELSKFLENIFSEERDHLVGLLDDILQYIDESESIKYPCKDIVLTKIGKLADHAELENIRLARIERIRHIGDKVSVERTQIESTIKDNEKLVESMRKTLNNNHAQLVSVLGIFAGIVIAVFGGLTFFSSVFNNVEKIGNYKLVFITALTGFTLFNVISFMLAVVAYLVDKPFPLLKSKNDGIIGRKQFYNKAYAFVNIIFILVMLATVLLWLKNI